MINNSLINNNLLNEINLIDDSSIDYATVNENDIIKEYEIVLYDKNEELKDQGYLNKLADIPILLFNLKFYRFSTLYEVIVHILKPNINKIYHVIIPEDNLDIDSNYIKELLKRQSVCKIYISYQNHISELKLQLIKRHESKVILIKMDITKLIRILIDKFFKEYDQILKKLYSNADNPYLVRSDFEYHLDSLKFSHELNKDKGITLRNSYPMKPPVIIPNAIFNRQFNNYKNSFSMLYNSTVHDQQPSNLFGGLNSSELLNESIISKNTEQRTYTPLLRITSTQLESNHNNHIRAYQHNKYNNFNENYFNKPKFESMDSKFDFLSKEISIKYSMNHYPKIRKAYDIEEDIINDLPLEKLDINNDDEDDKGIDINPEVYQKITDNDVIMKTYGINADFYERSNQSQEGIYPNPKLLDESLEFGKPATETFESTNGTYEKSNSINMKNSLDLIPIDEDQDAIQNPIQENIRQVHEIKANIDLITYEPQLYQDLPKFYEKLMDACEFQGNYTKVAQVQKKLLSLKSNYKSISTKVNLAKQYIKLGKLFQMINLTITALEIYKKCLKIYPNTNSSTSTNNNDTSKNLHKDIDIKSILYNYIGKCYYKLQDYDQALVYFQKNISLQRSQYGEKHGALAKVYKNIGYIYYHTQIFDKARFYLEKCLSILNNKNIKYSNSSSSISNNHNSGINKRRIYNLIANSYYHLQHYIRVIETCKKAKKESGLNWNYSLYDAYTYITLGYTHYRHGNDQYVKKCCKKIINLSRKLMFIHPDNYIQSKILYYLACLYYNIQQYKETLVYANISLDNIKQLDSKDKKIQLLTINVYECLGKVYEKLNRANYSILHYDLAISVCYINSPYLATLYDNIARVYYQQGDYNKSIEYYELCLIIIKKNNEEEEREEEKCLRMQEEAKYYDKIGKLYLVKGDRKTSIDFFTKAQEIKLQINDPSIIESYKYLSLISPTIAEVNLYDKKILEVQKNKKEFINPLSKRNTIETLSKTHKGKTYKEEDIIIKCDIHDVIRNLIDCLKVVWYQPLKSTNSKSKMYIEHLKKYCNVLQDNYEWYNEINLVGNQYNNVYCIIISVKNSNQIIDKINESCSSIPASCLPKIYLFNESDDDDDDPAKELNAYDLDSLDLIKITQNITCTITSSFAELQNSLISYLLKLRSDHTSYSKKFPSYISLFNPKDIRQANILTSYIKNLIQFDNKNQALRDFLDLFFFVYESQFEAKSVFEEKYNSKDILTCLNEIDCLHGLINDCISLATSDSIMYCRLIIHDLVLSIKQAPKTDWFNGTLYRCGYINDTEFSNIKNNIGKEIIIKGFLSATENYDSALAQGKKHKLNTIFKIIVSNVQDFMNELGYVRIPNTDELLFNTLSRFKIMHTSDEKTEDFNCIVLMYGAYELRKYMRLNKPKIVVDPARMMDSKCKHCNKTFRFEKNKPWFLSLYDKDHYSCLKCMSMKNINTKSLMIMINNPYEKLTLNGFIIHNKLDFDQESLKLPCYSCKKSLQKGNMYNCLNCKKISCYQCFNLAKKCIKEQHIVLHQDSIFYFWNEDMNEYEYSLMKYEQNMEDYLKDEFRHGQVFYSCNQYDKAIQYYEKCLKSCYNNSSTRTIVDCLNNLGEIYLQISNYDQALESYNKSYEISKIFYNDNINQSIAHHYLGSVYMVQHDYIKSLEHFSESLRLRNDTKNITDEMVIFFNNLGYIYYQLYEFDNSLSYINQALSINKQLYGEKYPNTALSLYHLGMLHDKQAQYNQAISYLQNSLQIIQNILGELHYSTALILKGLGLVFYHIGLYTASMQYFNNSLTIFKTTLSIESHPEILQCYHYKANIYLIQGNIDNAISFYQKSLDISNNLLSLNQPLIIENYIGLSNAYEIKGDFLHTLKYYLKAYDIISKYSTINSKNNNSNMIKLIKGFYHMYRGLLWKYIGEYTKALQEYEASLRQIEQLKGPDHPDVAYILYKIGEIYGLMKNHKQAIDYLLKAWRIQLNKPGEKHYQTAKMYSQLGQQYYHLEEYDKSVQYLQKSLEILQSIFDKETFNNHPDLAKIYFDLGTVYFHKGDYQKAIENHKLSLEIKRKIFGEDHYYTGISYNILGIVYDKIREFEKAKESFKKLLNVKRKKSQFKMQSPIVLKILTENNSDMICEYIKNYEKQLESFFENSSSTIAEPKNYEHALKLLVDYNMGSVFHHLGDHDAAILAFSSALESAGIIRTGIGTTGNDDGYNNSISLNGDLFYMIYNNLASGYYKKGYFDEAQVYFQKSLDSLINTPENNIQNALLLMNLGTVYQRKNQLDDGLNCFNRASEILLKNTKDINILAICYSNIAKIYETKKVYDKGLLYYSMALKIYLSIYKESHPELSQCYENIGLVNEYKKEYIKAKDYYRKALKGKKNWLENVQSKFKDNINNQGIQYYLNLLNERLIIHGDTSLVTVSSYFDIGNAYEILKDHEQAVVNYKKALDILNGTYKIEDISSNLIYLYLSLGYSYKHLGDYNTSIEIYKDALKIALINNEKTKEKIFLIDINFNLATLFRVLRKFDQVYNYGTASIRLAQELYGNNDPNTISIRKKYEDLIAERVSETMSNSIRFC